MLEPFNLQPMPISATAVPRALERALRYRLLNEPEQAESVCLDVLDVEPDNQEALVTLILSLTDQFATSDPAPSRTQVDHYISRLESDYQRHYYRGIMCERQARAALRRPLVSGFAFDEFREAMEWFEKAAAIRPEADDDALLRWNACVRTIHRRHLHSRFPEPEQPLE